MGEEVNTLARMGLTLLLVACAVVATLSIMFIINTFSDDFYEQVVTVVGDNDASLDDIIDVELPVPGIANTVNASKFRAYEIKYSVSAKPYLEGIGGEHVPIGILLPNVFTKECGHKTGVLTSYSVDDKAQKIVLNVRVGG